MFFRKMLVHVCAPHNGGKGFMAQAAIQLVAPQTPRRIKVRPLIESKAALFVSQKTYAPDDIVVNNVLGAIDFNESSPVILESLRTASQVEAVYATARQNGWQIMSLFRDLPRKRILENRDSTHHDEATILRALAEWDRHEADLIAAMARCGSDQMFFNLEESDGEWFVSEAHMCDVIRGKMAHRGFVGAPAMA